MDISTELIAALAATGGGITSFLKAFKFVQEGERGVKLQFGRALRKPNGDPRIIEPGFVFLIPFVQSLRRHHVRQQSRQCADQHITLKDGLIYKVGGMVVFKVVDVYKAMFDIDDIDASIDDLCMAAIRDELHQLTHSDLRDTEGIAKRLTQRVKPRAAEWGVEIIQFSLPECAPTPEAANLLNAALGVEMRLAALEEGLKKRQMQLSNVSPNLAAVLVGIPLTATVSENHTHTVIQNSEDQRLGKDEREEGSSSGASS